MREIKNKIYQEIDAEIKRSLDDIDLDRLLDPKKIKKIVDSEIASYIVNQVADNLRISVYTAIRKIKPQLDYWVDAKAREFIQSLGEDFGSTEEDGRSII